MTVRLAVTLGDPRGIGPEVVSQAAHALLEESPEVEFRFIGASAHDFTLPLETPVEFGGSVESAGRAAGAAIETAVALALDGQVDAVVTGPIHKPAFQAAGYGEPGHTELLMRLTDAPRVGMLMAAEHTRLGGPLRVLLATTHIALRDVPSLLTRRRLEEQVVLLHHSLCSGWGMAEPRLALCALNPHASDEGMFGDEEARVMTPALETLRRQGVSISDPLPADTVFSRTLAGEFEAVVAPYHDVGMAAFKTVSFGAGVNVTLGLPFPRTSPDHGTAFDLVGTGRARPDSTLQAMRLAVRLGRGAGASASL